MLNTPRALRGTKNGDITPHLLERSKITRSANGRPNFQFPYLKGIVRSSIRNTLVQPSEKHENMDKGHLVGGTRSSVIGILLLAVLLQMENGCQKEKTSETQEFSSAIVQQNRELIQKMTNEIDYITFHLSRLEQRTNALEQENERMKKEQLYQAYVKKILLGQGETKDNLSKKYGLAGMEWDGRMSSTALALLDDPEGFRLFGKEELEKANRYLNFHLELGLLEGTGEKLDFGSYAEKFFGFAKKDEYLKRFFTNKYGLEDEAWEKAVLEAQKNAKTRTDAKEFHKGRQMHLLNRSFLLELELTLIKAASLSPKQFLAENGIAEELVFNGHSREEVKRAMEEWFKGDSFDANTSPLHFYFRPHSAKKQAEENARAGQRLLKPHEIQETLAFMGESEEALLNAESVYGVNREIIVAILKLESQLGKTKLRYRALDVLLSQMAYAFTDQGARGEERAELERRAERIRSSARTNLVALLGYCLKHGKDPHSVKSNLVGAVGFPQFMPVNLEPYGADLTGDGYADLSDMGDAILSVAKYLNGKGGWSKLHGLSDPAPEEKGEIIQSILSYNNDTAYAESILKLAQEISAAGQR